MKITRSLEQSSRVWPTPLPTHKSGPERANSAWPKANALSAGQTTVLATRPGGSAPGRSAGADPLSWVPDYADGTALDAAARLGTRQNDEPWPARRMDPPRHTRRAA